MSGILQYMHNARTNVESESESEFVTVPSHVKCYKLVELLDTSNPSASTSSLDASISSPEASNPAASLTVYESKVKLSASNKAPLGLFTTKTRSCLRDESLDVLCFFRTYFKSNKEELPIKELNLIFSKLFLQI